MFLTKMHIAGLCSSWTSTQERRRYWEQSLTSSSKNTIFHRVFCHYLSHCIYYKSNVFPFRCHFRCLFNFIAGIIAISIVIATKTISQVGGKHKLQLEHFLKPASDSSLLTNDVMWTLAQLQRHQDLSFPENWDESKFDWLQYLTCDYWFLNFKSKAQLRNYPCDVRYFGTMSLKRLRTLGGEIGWCEKGKSNRRERNALEKLRLANQKKLKWNPKLVKSVNIEIRNPVSEQSFAIINSFIVFIPPQDLSTAWYICHPLMICH